MPCSAPRSRVSQASPAKPMCQPPKKMAVVTAARMTTSANSEIMNRPNFIPEYSTK